MVVEHGHAARGIDLNAVAAARRFLASRGRDPMRVSCGSPAETIPTGLTLDNVISMDTLEHNAGDHRAFAQLAELTRPGSRLIVTVPALMASARAIGTWDISGAIRVNPCARWRRPTASASTIFGTGT